MHNFYRGRRLRRSSNIRQMLRETVLTPADLVQPYFVLEHEDPDYYSPISSMPGQSQLGISALLKRVARARESGLKAVILFGIPWEKDEYASEAYRGNGIIQRSIRELKENFPELTVITDVCMCEYTSHGHCGIVQDGYVQNDLTLPYLAEIALSHARAGADMVAPSDMMDGRVGEIRRCLDQNGYTDLPVISYAVKYSSAFYGPFREAAESSPSFGDRKTYQMDPANSREALREARADISEGADVLMVKPALAYLDVLNCLRGSFDYPLAAYHVSGEYSLIKAAAAQGWIDEHAVALEALSSIKRAGADIILSYYTEEVLELL